MFDPCPRCGSSAKPKEEGGLSTCSNCGFESQIEDGNSGVSVLGNIAKTIVIILAIAVGLILVGAAIFYAGCACIMKGGL